MSLHISIIVVLLFVILACVVYRNEGARKPKLVSYVKEKGEVGSDATIYGYHGKRGISEKMVNSGFAAKNEKHIHLWRE